MKQSKFAAFIEKVSRIWDAQNDDVFYIYPDILQLKNHNIPETLEDAYANGFLTIEAQSPGVYYLRLENQEHFSSNIWELEQILFNWSLSEGYIWQ